MQQTPSPPPSSNLLDQQLQQEKHQRMNLDFALPQEIENVVSPDSVIPNASTAANASANNSSSKGPPKGVEILHPQSISTTPTDRTHNFALPSDIDITPLEPPPSDVNLPLPPDNDINNDNIETTVNLIKSQDDCTHEPQLSPALSQDEENTVPIVISSPIIQQESQHHDETDVHFNANPSSVERQFDDTTTSQPVGNSSPINVDINAIVIPSFNPATSHIGTDADTDQVEGPVNVDLNGNAIPHAIPPTSSPFTTTTPPADTVNVDAKGDLIPSSVDTHAQFNPPRSASNPPAAVNVDVNGDIIPPPVPHPQFDPTTADMFAFMEHDGVGEEVFDNSTSTPVRHRNGAPYAGQGEGEMKIDENGTGETGHEFLFNEYELDSPDTNNSNSICGLQEGRVEASKMGQVENPLQKRGRHTVITGHLPEDNPYAIAEKNLGVKMCSLKWTATTVVGLSKEEAFARDLQQFLVEIHLTGYKVPVIGGGPLDLFALMREVLLLGGVTNVVKKRAFRIVGQQLELPKSCTSAAFVLKNAYTRLLFYYERKLVFDEMPPENPARNVNIKQIVAADKEREKMEAKLRHGVGRNSGNHVGNNNLNTDMDLEINMNMAIGNGFRGSDDSNNIGNGSGNKKRNLIMMNTATTPTSPTPSPSSYILDTGNGSDYEERKTCTGPLKRARYCYSTSGTKAGLNNSNDNNEGNMAEITPMGSAADYQFSQEYYMSLVSNYPPPSVVSNMTMNEGTQYQYQYQYSLPEWAKSRVSEQHYQAFVDAAHTLDDRHEVETALDVILIAIAHCFQATDSTSAPPGMKHCLAYRILIQDPIMCRARLVVLIEILGDMISSNQCPPLAHNQAANALIDGFFHLIQTYLNNSGDKKTTTKSLPNEGDGNTVRIAGAYLSIALLDTLAIDQRNRAHIIRNGKKFAEITGMKLIASGSKVQVHAKISEASRDLWEKISGDAISREFFVQCESTLKYLAELAIRNATGSRSAIVILGGFAKSIYVESPVVPVVVRACTKSLESAISASASTTGTTTVMNMNMETEIETAKGTDETASAFLAYMLAANCTAYVREKKEFVQALVKRAGKDYTNNNNNRNDGDENENITNIWNSYAVKALAELHREKSLVEYKERIQFFFKEDDDIAVDIVS